MSHLAASSEAEAIYAKALRLETKIGGLDEAEKLYRRFWELAPEDPRGPNKVGVCCALRGNLDGAEEHFQKALELDPQYPPALTNLGNVLLERNNLEGAVVRYEEALRYDPDYSAAHNNLAAALKRMGSIRPAVQHLRQAQRSMRKEDREAARKDAQRGCGSSGSKAVILLAAGVLTYGVFWR